MAEEQQQFGKPKMLGPNEHLEIVNGQFVRMPGAPNPDKGKETVLNTGYQKNDFQAAAQAQGLYGTPSQDSTNVASTIPAAPASPMVDSTQTTTFTAPITHVENVVANTASAPGTTVTSDLTKTVQVGIEMNDNAQNVTENLLFPNNGN